MTLTLSSSSLAFFRSAFIGYAVTDPRVGPGSQIVQISSMSVTSLLETIAVGVDSCACCRRVLKVVTQADQLHRRGRPNLIDGTTLMRLTPLLQRAGIARGITYFANSRSQFYERLVKVTWLVSGLDQGRCTTP